MPKIRASYESQDEIPEPYRDLYTDRDGTWEITGVEGIKTQSDIDRLNTANRKERDARRKAEKALEAFGGKSPEEIASDIDELEELRAQKADGDDDTLEERVEKLAAKRLKTKMGPLQREHDKLKKSYSDLEGDRDGLRTEIRNIKISDSLRSATSKADVRKSAVDDVLLYGTNVFELTEDGATQTRDGVGVTPGLSPDEWLKDMKESRPHWWDASRGGGSKGSGDGGNSGIDTDKLTPREKLGYGWSS